MLTRLKYILKNLLQQKAVILMYHQVCHRMSDPWELAVTPERFDEQLGFLRKNFDVVPLDELAALVRRKDLGSGKIAITFDDGFSDNFTQARPILESYNLPATFYLATQALVSDQLYWWDELELIILHTPQLPRKLELTIAGKAFRFEFITDDVLTRHLIGEIRGWNAAMEPPNERAALFLKLWQRIQPMQFHDQRRILSEIRQWAGIIHVPGSHASVMSLRDMSLLGTNPLFSIGAHTVHHAMLGQQGVEDQAFEVQESKKVIENLLGREVTGFAYPYGNYNAVTKSLLRNAGFRYAVSTECRCVTDQDDLFELPRLQVKNWTAKDLSLNLQQLLNHEK